MARPKDTEFLATKERREYKGFKPRNTITRNITGSTHTPQRHRRDIFCPVVAAEITRLILKAVLYGASPRRRRRVKGLLHFVSLCSHAHCGIQGQLEVNVRGPASPSRALAGRAVFGTDSGTSGKLFNISIDKTINRFIVKQKTTTIDRNPAADSLLGVIARDDLQIAQSIIGMTLFRHKTKAGVTLVELLCVIAIIGILVGLLIGPIFKGLSHAKKVLGNTPSGINEHQH
jgi:prepilin-type N-terminal cleavage/methylation domain-containing protein